MKTLRIGIRSHDDAKKRLLAIARGQASQAANEPTVWLASMASLAQLLSEENMGLLEIIRKHRPASISRLAERAGRSLPSLSRTLARMEEYGLIALETVGRAKAPRVTFDRLEIVLVEPAAGKMRAA